MKFATCFPVMAAALVVASEPTFQVIVTSAASFTVSLSDLRKSLMVVACKVNSPVYKKPMTYRGFWLEDVLQTLHLSAHKEIGFESADGYGTAISSQEIGKNNWLLAFSETDGGWTPLPGHKEVRTPGPWYLVGKTPASYKETPWPYGVTKIKILKEF